MAIKPQRQNAQTSVFSAWCGGRRRLILLLFDSHEVRQLSLRASVDPASAQQVDRIFCLYCSSHTVGTSAALAAPAVPEAVQPALHVCVERPHLRKLLHVLIQYFWIQSRLLGSSQMVLLPALPRYHPGAGALISLVVPERSRPATKETLYFSSNSFDPSGNFRTCCCSCPHQGSPG